MRQNKVYGTKKILVAFGILIMLLFATIATIATNGQTGEQKDNFVYVEGGSFNMGSNEREANEKPINFVTLSSFYISKTELTVKEYRAYCNATGKSLPEKPSWGWNDKDPIVNVSRNDAQAYCKWAGVRLPTEAEWEYAARGGNKSQGYEYSGSDNMDEVAWYNNNSNDKVHQVGTQQPNELGLYDMSGNAYEWYNDRNSALDPKEAESESYLLFRGGSWCNDDFMCRVSDRGVNFPLSGYNYLVGFRTSTTNGQIGKQKDNFVFVEGGSFNMGSNEDLSKKPVHKVTLSSFYISKTEVTVKEYSSYCQATGIEIPDAASWGRNDNDPIVRVSWNDALGYCKWAGVRLPTEAEWEYAARGGNKSKGYKYSGSDNLDNVAWYDKNSNGKVHEVGTKQANELGLYDMSGNVWEWCSDWYGKYKSNDQRDPIGAESGLSRLLRGGSWYSYGDDRWRVSDRDKVAPDIRSDFVGFRVVRH